MEQFTVGGLRSELFSGIHYFYTMYQKKGTFEEEQNIVYGVRAVIEAVRADRPINKIFIQRGMQKDLFYELKDALADKKYHLQFVPIYKLNKMTRKNHQGVIAQVSPIPYQDLEPIVEQLFEKGEMPLFILLDRLTDVRNFGAIARTAECLGVHAIILPQKDSVSITADAIKTSAGALHKIPVCKVPDLYSTIHYLKESGIQIAAATEKTKTLLPDNDLTVPVAIVMGSEEDGVSLKVLAESDMKLKIPMLGSIASLNVSVAAGMVLYEAIRQRELA